MSGQIHEEPTERFDVLQPGAVWLERFEFLRMLGRGGIGSVWEVEDRLLRQRVALKVLPEMLRWDEAGMRRIRNEVQRTRELLHPNIVRLHDLHVGPTGMAISMELVAGQTLSRWRLDLPGGIAAPGDIIGWLPDLAAALDHAHGHGVVHRDIKPANLLLSATGEIKVADFGVSAQTTETLARVSSVMSSGTLVYMSPQQLWGEPGRVSDDVYAVGATLYELLCGEPPFLRGDLSSQVAQRDPTPINRRREQLGIAERVPANWEAVIASCLAKQASDRPASVGEAVGRLLAVSAGPASPWRWPVSRTRTTVTGVAILILCVFGVGLWGISPRPGRPETGSQPLTWAGSTAPPSNERPMREPDPDAERGGTVGVPQGIDPSSVGTSPLVQGSLASGLFTMLPLDGRSVDVCGGHFNADGLGGEWVADRFGHPSGALALSGRAWLAQNLPVNLAVEGENRFSLSFWLLVTSGSGAIVDLVPEQAGELAVTLVVDAGRLHVYAGAHTERIKGHISSEPVVDNGRWMHVVLAVEDNRFQVWGDGRLVCESDALLPAPAKPVLGFSLRWRKLSAAVKSLPDMVIDDVRMWRQRLSASAIRSLAREDFRPQQNVVWQDAITWPWESSMRYVSTANAYSDADDWELAVQTEFGAQAGVADWREIAAAAGPWPSLWAELVGLEADGVRFVTRDGATKFQPERTYLLNRFSRSVPGYYLAHGVVGEGQLALGSWHGREFRVLATVPEGHSHLVDVWDRAFLKTAAAISGASTATETNRAAAGAAAGGRVERRIWLFELEPEFMNSRGLALRLPGGPDVSLTRTNPASEWFFELRSRPDSLPVRRMVVLPARRHLGVVIQHPNRLYCALIALGQTAPTIDTEFALSDLPDDDWVTTEAASWSLTPVSPSEPGSKLSDMLAKLTYVQVKKPIR